MQLSSNVMYIIRDGLVFDCLLSLKSFLGGASIRCTCVKDKYLLLVPKVAGESNSTAGSLSKFSVVHKPLFRRIYLGTIFHSNFYLLIILFFCCCAFLCAILIMVPNNSCNQERVKNTEVTKKGGEIPLLLT